MNFLTLTLCHCGFIIEEECAMHPTVQSAATFWWFLSVLNRPSLNACTTWLRRNTIFNSYFHKWFLSKALVSIKEKIREIEGPDMKENMQDQIRQWFIECRLVSQQTFPFNSHEWPRQSLSSAGYKYYSLFEQLCTGLNFVW